jgi:hypothetical protein
VSTVLCTSRTKNPINANKGSQKLQNDNLAVHLSHYAAKGALATALR